MLRLRKCLMCTTVIYHHDRIDKDTCSVNCRNKLMRAVRKYQNWQENLSERESEALDQIQRISTGRSVPPFFTFEDVMRFGNVHGEVATGKLLNIVADILSMYTIY